MPVEIRHYIAWQVRISLATNQNQRIGKFLIFCVQKKAQKILVFCL